jgi:cytochrome c biogenesis protein CcdA
MHEGMEPEVKKYFRKILNSFGIGFLWMFGIATAGFYFELALVDDTIRWYNYLFYVIFGLTLILLIRFYYKLWKH